MKRDDDVWSSEYDEVWGQEVDEDRPIRISDPSLLDDSYKGRYVRSGTSSQLKNKDVRKVEKSMSSSGAGKGKLVIFVLLIIFCAAVTIVAVNSDEYASYDSEYEEGYYDDEDDYDDTDEYTDIIEGLSYSVSGEWERNEDDETESCNYYKDNISLNVFAVDSDEDIEDEEIREIYKKSMEESGNTVTKTEDIEVDGRAAYVIYSTYQDKDDKDYVMNYKTLVINGDESIVEFICSYYEEDQEEAIEAFDEVIDSISS